MINMITFQLIVYSLKYFYWLNQRIRKKNYFIAIAPFQVRL